MNTMYGCLLSILLSTVYAGIWIRYTLDCFVGIIWRTPHDIHVGVSLTLIVGGHTKVHSEESGDDGSGGIVLSLT